MSWNDTEPMVSIRDIYKSFGTLEVLKGVSLDVMKGEVICIIGPSGSGKSTLIRCINGLNDIQEHTTEANQHQPTRDCSHPRIL